MQRRAQQREQDGTVRQCTEAGESTTKTVGDWRYHEGFIAATLDFVLGTVKDDCTRPEEICSILQEGRRSRENREPLPAMPDSYSTGKRDAEFDCDCGKSLVKVPAADSQKSCEVTDRPKPLDDSHSTGRGVAPEEDRVETMNPTAVAKPEEGTVTPEDAAGFKMCQSMDDAIDHIEDYLCAHANRGQITVDFDFKDRVCMLTVEMEEVKERTGQVPLAGEPGSAVLFIRSSDVPSDTPTEYILSRILEHMPVTPGKLIVIVPTGIFLFSIFDDLPEELKQQVLGYMKRVQREREMLQQEQDDTVPRPAEDTESTAKTSGDWRYNEGYTVTIQSFVEAVARSDSMDSEEIRSMLQEGRKFRESQNLLPTANDSYSNGVLTAAYDCGSSIAMGYPVTTNQGIALGDAAIIEECFGLERDDIEHLLALKHFHNKLLEAFGPFPDPVKSRGKFYWSLAAVRDWVRNYERVCTIRAACTDMTQRFPYFIGEFEKEQNPAWVPGITEQIDISWNRMFGNRTSDDEAESDTNPTGQPTPPHADVPAPPTAEPTTGTARVDSAPEKSAVDTSTVP
jgi:hypothetical protein